MGLSGWLHSGARAGYLPPGTVADGVDRLDTVAVPDFDLNLLCHGYVAQAEGVLYDMIERIRHATPPRQRPRLEASGAYWIIRR